MNDRVIGLDPGERRIGVAISDRLGIIAQPHSVIDIKATDVEAELKRLVEQEEVQFVVVGLPVSLNGQERDRAIAARRFGAVVAEATGLEVEYMDERFTTKVAEQTLIEGRVRRSARRELVDKVAAAVMLQGFLDRRRT